MSAGTSRTVNIEQDGGFVMAVLRIEHTRRPSTIHKTRGLLDAEPDLTNISV